MRYVFSSISHTSPFFHFYIFSTLNHSLYKLYLLNFTHFNYFLISFCSFFQSLSKVLNLNIINSTILHQLSISQVSLRYSPHLLRPIRLKIMRPSLNIPWTFKPCAPTLLWTGTGSLNTLKPTLTWLWPTVYATTPRILCTTRPAWNYETKEDRFVVVLVVHW